MFPRYTPYNFTDSHLRNAEPLRDVCLRVVPSGVHSADLADRVIRQDRTGMLYPNVSTALAYTVAVVVLLASKKEVIRANACRIVAVVANALGGSYRAVVEFVGNAVRVERFSVMTQAAITGSCKRANPDPASIGLLDFGPETSNELLVSSCYSRHINLPNRLVMPRALQALRGFVMPHYNT